MDTGAGVRVVHSLWDRLQMRPAEHVALSTDVESIKAEVRRDLQWLLNTRRHARDEELDLPHLDRSLLAFGIPELSAVNPNSSNDRDHLALVICRAIERFEPRLSGVEVEPLPRSRDDGLPHLHFRIRAAIRIEGVSGPIVFDTSLDLGSRIFAVRT